MKSSHFRRPRHRPVFRSDMQDHDCTPALALCVRIEELRRREHDMEAMNTRRSLMTGLGAAAAAAVLVPASTGAQTRANNFRPARHANDSWMDELKGQHRVFIDSATPSGGAEALLYANNLYMANDSG